MARQVSAFLKASLENEQMQQFCSLKLGPSYQILVVRMVASQRVACWPSKQMNPPVQTQPPPIEEISLHHHEISLMPSAVHPSSAEGTGRGP